MLIDANLLLYSVDSESPHHARAHAWLGEALDGPGRVGLAWESIGAFLRIATHPRASRSPMSAAEAWEIVEAWLARPSVWSPERGPRHAEILASLIARHAPAGNLLPDAMLAALALEHGLAVASADGDFARFAEIRWINPLA